MEEKKKNERLEEMDEALTEEAMDEALTEEAMDAVAGGQNPMFWRPEA